MRAKLLLLLCGLALGCSVAASGSVSVRAGNAPNAGDEVAPLRAPTEPPVLGQGVTEAATACEQGAAEVCNALDDDCDGAIDEGDCGYAGGALQVTVAWNSGADIDLYVTDPRGESVSFQRRQSASGAHLDHAARGACSEQPQQRIENVRYAERPPSGDYSVELHYLFECESSAGLATATISVSAAGELVGTYNYTLSPNERVEVLRFTLP